MPALVVERLRPVEAMSRSWELVQGNWWRTFGLLVFTLGLLGLVVSDGPGLLIKWAIGNVAQLDAAGNQAVTLVVGGAMTLLFLPVEYVVGVVYYFDLRVRREGFDLETAVAERYAADGARRGVASQEAVPAAPGRAMLRGGIGGLGPSGLPGEHTTAMSTEWSNRVKTGRTRKRHGKVISSKNPEGAAERAGQHTTGERGGS